MSTNVYALCDCETIGLVDLKNTLILFKLINKGINVDLAFLSLNVNLRSILPQENDFLYTQSTLKKEAT